MRSGDDIDLIDLAITAAESWKILLVGPLLVGAVAFGISQLLPQQFESAVTVPLSVANNQMLVSAGGVGAILAYRAPGEEGASTRGLLSDEQARFRMSARNSLSGTVDVSVKSSDPRRTQQLLSAFIERLAALVLAGNSTAASQIERKIKAYMRQNESLERVLLSLASAAPVMASDAGQRSSADFAAVTLQLTTQIRDSQIAIGGLNDDLVEARKTLLSRAILPGEPVNRNSAFISLICFTLSLIALATFVYAREAFRKACGNAEVSSKLARLRRAFRPGS